MSDRGRNAQPTDETSDVLPAIDAHVHLWDPARVPLSWMRPEHALIDRAFTPGDLEPLLARAGIAAVVLVQSACLDADTDLMFEHAEACAAIAAVVAWVALEDPPRAADRLAELAQRPQLRGVRHLIHDEADPHWILRPRVLEGIALLEAHGLILELPAVFPRHLGDVPELARSFPDLTIVIDHLGKPPLASDAMPQWARALETAAGHANVAAKLSGLNTATADPRWTAADLRPAVDVAVEAFGPDRLLCGSDWPVALLNGDYERVWRGTRRLVARARAGPRPGAAGGHRAPHLPARRQWPRADPRPLLARGKPWL